MHGPNGNSQAAWAQHMLDEQFEAFRAGVKKMIGRIMAEPEPPSRLRKLATLATKARDLIEAHPIVAASLVLGLGYVARRLEGWRDPAGAGR